mmetsp:Transcript_9885/g.11172  ORF Transcript_9885/g.11172 Transcript_9885/m.11172 type:complete len:184 (+) Transcript_9885:25-576(+)
MGKFYAFEPVDAAKACKARGSNLRVHFKNTHEVAAAIKGMRLKRAQKYLQDVIQHKDTIPFRVFTGGIGHHAQAKRHGAVSSRWPEKSCRYVLDLLLNAESNAEIQGLETESLFVHHIQVNRAPKLRRRTYRAHGRINPYMSSPCHVELILSQKPDEVAKAADAKPRRRRRQARLKNGASADE